VDAIEKFLIFMGCVSGLTGVLVCLVTGAARIGGSYWLGGFQAGTLLQAGVAVMLFGCFCLLLALVARRR
jgi:hypothetical protein